jgi:hypothetical protein
LNPTRTLWIPPQPEPGSPSIPFYLEDAVDQSRTIGFLQPVYDVVLGQSVYGTAPQQTVYDAIFAETASRTALPGSVVLLDIEPLNVISIGSPSEVLFDFCSSATNVYYTAATSQGTPQITAPAGCLLNADNYWLPLQTGSSTAPTRDPRYMEKLQRFRVAFQRAAKEHFEDGMDSDFTDELEALVRGFRNDARTILSSLLGDQTISPSVWAEAMRWLGRAGGLLSNSSRLWLLEKGLTSIHAAIRDGATLGLSSLDDPSAITYLERAAANEPLTGLRQDMEDVISQLKSEQPCFT